MATKKIKKETEAAVEAGLDIVTVTVNDAMKAGGQSLDDPGQTVHRY